MRTLVFSAMLFLAPVSSLRAGTVYVNVDNPAPLAPFNSWSTAATNIQDAVDAAMPGDLVLVTNGNYQVGERSVGGVAIVNRVAVNKPLIVASVNGPAVTFIHGRKVGRTSLRGIYLADGAVLSGFTVTNGTAQVEQSVDSGLGGGIYCQSTAAVVTNCIISGNQAVSGGAVYLGTLHNCVLRDNSARFGGAAYQATLNNCAVLDNRATVHGGGAFQGRLAHCTVVNNTAQTAGGGIFEATAQDCIVYFNGAPADPNHSASSLNFSCTSPLPGTGVGNIPSDPQLTTAFHLGAASPCRAAADPAGATGLDCDGETWNHPPSMGCDEYRPGQIAGPLQVDFSTDNTNVTPAYVVKLMGSISGKASAVAWHLGDGTTISNRLAVTHAWNTSGIFPVTLIAYNEDYPLGISVTQRVEVVAQTIFYVAQDSATPVPPYADWATAAADIQSAIDLATVPGQRVVVSNGVYKTGGRQFGSTFFGNTTNRVVVPRPIRVSSVNGPALTSIEGQRAIDGGIGPGAIRCVYLAAGAVLDGFTLSGGATDSIDSGGGVYCQSPASVVTNCVLQANYGYNGGGVASGTVNNCVLRSNSAYAWGGGSYAATLNGCTVHNNGAVEDGGGASHCTLNNCVLDSNLAIENGGGAQFCTLRNCILRRNTAEHGGASYYDILSNCTLANNYGYSSAGGSLYSILLNCIIYHNGSPSAPNVFGGQTRFCCTPEAAGMGNITNAPLLTDVAAGNFRLQPGSPCINSGHNSNAPGPFDLDGNPRIAGGTVDIGAYEFPKPGSALSFAWAYQYGLPTDGSQDMADDDGDGVSNWLEWRADTIPTNELSFFRVLGITPVPTGTTVSWLGMSTRSYFVERATNLQAGLMASSFRTIVTNIAGIGGTNTFTDTNVAVGGRYFYRVAVP